MKEEERNTRGVSECKNVERCCVNCCHFKYEDVDGWGICEKLHKHRPKTNGVTYCGDVCTCDAFVSDGKKTHYLALLRKCKRCLNENMGTSKDVDVQSISEAIDFVIDYANTY